MGKLEQLHNTKIAQISISGFAQGESAHTGVKHINGIYQRQVGWGLLVLIERIIDHKVPSRPYKDKSTDGDSHGLTVFHLVAGGHKGLGIISGGNSSHGEGLLRGFTNQ